MRSLQITLPSMLLAWLHRLQTGCQSVQRQAQSILHEPSSAEFVAWRQRFLAERVRLLAWVAFIMLATVTIINLAITIPGLNDLNDPKFEFGTTRLFDYTLTAVLQLLGILACLLLKPSLVRSHPQIIFLLLASAVLLPSQILALLQGEAQHDADLWILFFAIQAILIPVQWRLHLLSQFTIFSLVSITMLVGWRDPDVIIPVAYVVGSAYSGLICLIADLGVFLYERAVQRQFELRQQLQVFLHAVSHDLRNPVIGMTMTLKSFLRPSGEAAKVPQELLEQIIASGDRQVNLINSLLETHAVELHGMTLHHQPIQLGQLVQEILRDFQPFFQQEKTIVSNHVSQELPTLQADALHLRRVYENLISNALKYNPPGLQLTFTAEIVEAKTWKRQNLRRSPSHSPDCWLHCTISDNGSGLTPEQCDRLFDLYSRGPNKRQAIGLGLGLYMCKQIITAHGGEIGVLSDQGRGSTFWFTLPL